MASKKDDEGRPPTGSVRPPPQPQPRARPQIRPIGGDKAPPPAPRGLRAPISLPSASVRIAQKNAPKAPELGAERPMPRFPSMAAIEDEDAATRTQAPPELFQEPPPPRRAPAQTIRGNPPPALGAARPTPAAPAGAPAAKPFPAQSRTAPAARIAAPAPRISAPTPIPPRISAPTPVSPRIPPAPLPPTRTEARPAARVDVRPARPAIDVVPQGQRAPAERTVVMPAAPGRVGSARVMPPVQPVRAKFPPAREPRPEAPTARPPAPSAPSLGALIGPIAVPKTTTSRPAALDQERPPTERPPANRSPFVHTRTIPSTTHETQALPNPPGVRQTRTDRPAARAPSVAPPRLHPPSFPPPQMRAPSVAPPRFDEPAGHEHRDETLAMQRPWPTPSAPSVMPMQPPHVQAMLMPTQQPMPVMAHPGFAASAPIYAPPAFVPPVAAQRPSPFGLVIFAAPLALATAALAALALLF